MAAPNRSPFQSTSSGKATRPSFHALPSSAGVTATGAKEQAGFADEDAALAAHPAALGNHRALLERRIADMAAKIQKVKGITKVIDLIRVAG